MAFLEIILISSTSLNKGSKYLTNRLVSSFDPIAFI